MKSKSSILILVFLMFVVTVTGRMAKVSEEKQQMEVWLLRQQELLKVTEAENQLEKVKHENNILKKEVSRPIKDRIISEIRRVFQDKAHIALALISCENNPFKSDYNPYAVNYNSNSYDSGVFQLNSVHIRRFGNEFTKDWKANIKVAYAIFKEQGVQPWYSSNGCHHLLDKLANK